MDELTLFEFEDVRARQAELNCLGCHEPASGLAGIWDCISHPVDCVTEAWTGEPATETKRMPDRPAQKTPKPLPSPGAKPQVLRPYVGPECPPALVSACSAPGSTFDPLTCSCQLPGAGGDEILDGKMRPEVLERVRRDDLLKVAAVGFGTLALLLLLRRR